MIARKTTAKFRKYLRQHQKPHFPGCFLNRLTNMETLESLPDELLLLICEHLASQPTSIHDKPYDQATFYNLCLVSQRWNCIATPFLYATIGLSSSSFAGRKLLRTLLAKPFLAEHITVVRQVSPSEEVSNGSIHHPKMFADTNTILPMAEQLDIWENPDTDFRLWVPGQDRDLAILLFQSPKIKSIYFQTSESELLRDSRELPTWIMALGQIAQGQQLGKIHHFSSLRNIYIEMHGIASMELFPLFLLPSLVNLSISHLGVYSDQGEGSGYEDDPQIVYGRPWTWKKPCNNIQRLAFHFPAQLGTTIINAIASCKALRSFELDMGSDQIASDFKDLKTGVLKALFAHADTLEELRMSGTYTRTEARELGDLGSLCELKHLKVLSAPVYLLKRPNSPQRAIKYTELDDIHLPPSIQNLALRIEHDTKTSHLDLYLESLYFSLRDHKLPHLKTITFHSSYRTVSSPLDIPHIHNLFSTVGVTIHYYILLQTTFFSFDLPEQATPWILEEYLRVEQWVEELRKLPNLVRLEQEGGNAIVATSLRQEVVDEEVRYMHIR